MRLGFPRERAALGFYSERNARVAVESGRTAEIERASVVAQAGARAHGALPAQAHVAACAREEVGRAGFLRFLGKIVTMSPRADFHIFLFLEN